ncbi:MAG: DnaA/Hda family protein, partial [Myxococcota bacterium]
MNSIKPIPLELWTSFLTDVRSQLSTHVFETWLRPVRCRDFTDGVITLEVRDQFSRDWLHDHYLDFIRDRLSNQLEQPVAVEWSINPNLQTDEPAPAIIDSEPSTVSDSIDSSPSHLRQLNKRYVFDSFVAGPSNQFAFAACKAVAETPGKVYNPLFLFGRTGLGKTHLASAIGHQILQDRRQCRVIYTSSEQFTNEVVNAVLGGKLIEFQAKYRNHCDVLVID